MTQDERLLFLGCETEDSYGREQHCDFLRWALGPIRLKCAYGSGAPTDVVKLEECPRRGCQVKVDRLDRGGQVTRYSRKNLD